MILGVFGYQNLEKTCKSVRDDKTKKGYEIINLR